ncbi:addiction module protein [Algiphilus aromaticivorans]|uniref:addiction module protein n=1 Tax=Algiphilus aromaticivorans TaxID=382454 RepID=UPI0005C20E10|nr:addiction module protein [Algiphilus aromaticivorans]
MSRPIEALEAELLRLPTAERARLLDRVVASLDVDKARDEAWDRVAAERDAELDTGSVAPMTGAATIARLRQQLD